MCDRADVADRALAALRQAPGLTGSTLATRLAAEGICAPHADVALRQLHRKAKIAGPKGQPLPRDLSVDDLRTQSLAVAAEPEWIVGGCYRVHRDQLLGQGAAAKVYRADHLRLKRSVAVKVIAPGDSPLDSPRAEILRRARAEGEVLARLQHPHILPVFDAGEEGGATWIATALCEGGNLASKIRREGPLPPKTVAGHLLAIAEAVEAAAERGILHRDLKPENVLFDVTGHLYVGDFGLARLQRLPGQVDGYGEIHPPTAPGTAVGTPQYLAPERANGERGDIRSDIYSLGATAYEMATGRALFDLENKPEAQLQWLYHHLNVPPVPLPRRRPDFPKALEEVIGHCLAKRPCDRYQTVRALVKDLRRYLASLPADPTSRETLDAPAPSMTARVSSFLQAVDADAVMIQAAYEERHGAGCFESPAFLRAIWALVGERQLMPLCASLQQVVSPAEFATGLEARLAALDTGAPAPSTLPVDPIDYLWIAVHRTADAKSRGEVPDTTPVEALQKFLKESLGNSRLPAAAPTAPVAAMPEPPPTPAAEVAVDRATAAAPDSIPAVVDDDLPEGLVINGRLRVLNRLGKGGMGVVYRAHDTILERDVAVKLMLNAGLSADAESQARFLREARNAAKLKHENIVTVYEAAFWDVESPLGRKRIPYLAMELVQGKTLTELRAERGTFEAEEALGIVRQALSGLVAAQGLGLVHRDLKPDNIMVDDAGVVKIMDFGLSRSVHPKVDNVTASGVFLGTIEFASPEQIASEPTDGRSDLYSLGVVLYELLSGTRPYSTDATNKLPLLKDISDPAHRPMRLRERATEIAECVDRFVHRLLAKRREDRPSSAVEAINELDAVVEELKQNGDHPGSRSVRRFAAVGALLVMILVATAVLLSKNPRDTRQGQGLAQKPDERRVEASKEKLESAPAAREEDGAAPPRKDPVEQPKEPDKRVEEKESKPAPSGPRIRERLAKYVPTEPELALIADLRGVFRHHYSGLRARQFGEAEASLKSLAEDPRHTDLTRALHGGASNLLDLAERCVAVRHGELRKAAGSITVRLAGGRVANGTVAASDEGGITLATDGSGSARVAFSELSLDDYLQESAPERGAMALRVIAGDSATVLSQLLTLATAEDAPALWLPFVLTVASERGRAFVEANQIAEAKAEFDPLAAAFKDALGLHPWLKSESDQAAREAQSLALLLEGQDAAVLVGFKATFAHPVAAKRVFDAATAVLTDDLIANELVLDWVLRPEEKKDSMKFFDLYDKDGVEGLILRDRTGQHSMLPKQPLRTVGKGLALTFRTTFLGEGAYVRLSLDSTKGGAHLRLDARDLSLRRARMEGPESDILESAAAPAAKKDAWRTLTLVPSESVKVQFVYLDGALLFHAPLDEAAIPHQFALTVSAAEIVIRSIKARPVK